MGTYHLAFFVEKKEHYFASINIYESEQNEDSYYLNSKKFFHKKKIYCN